MPYILDQATNTGSFVPTTTVLDTQQIYATEVTDPAFKELIVRLTQFINSMALVLNAKDSGYYELTEFVTGSLFFNPASSSLLDQRPVFRLLVNTGNLAAGVTSTPHLLPVTATWQFVKIFGVACKSTTLVNYPLPYASPNGLQNISVVVNGTNVVVTNMSGVVFDKSYVILEYLKQS